MTSTAEGKRLPEAWPDTYGDEAMPRMGFFTDTSVCIGCKACEVACKEWNSSPRTASTGPARATTTRAQLGANTLAPRRLHRAARATAARRRDGHVAGAAAVAPEPLRWLMESRRLQALHACRLPRCLSRRGALPHRVRDGRRAGGRLQRLRLLRARLPVRRDRPARICPEPEDAPLALPLLGKQEDGRVWKCTLCYDRLKGGHEPACAKACPTNSIQFGALDELRERADAAAREAARQKAGTAPRLYGERPGRRRRRLRRVLPAARRARGLRAAARSGRSDRASCRGSGARRRWPRRAMFVGLAAVFIGGRE